MGKETDSGPRRFIFLKSPCRQTLVNSNSLSKYRLSPSLFFVCLFVCAYVCVPGNMSRYLQCVCTFSSRNVYLNFCQWKITTSPVANMLCFVLFQGQNLSVLSIASRSSFPFSAQKTLHKSSSECWSCEENSKGGGEVSGE